MKKFFIVLFVLIGLLVGGGYFLFLEALKPGDVPVKVMNAEEVIATSGTIAIASIDMSYMRRIDDILNAGADPAPHSTIKEAKPAKTFLEKLNKQGVDLLSKTDYALATISIDDVKPAYTVVLFGRFSQTKLKKAIRHNYITDESANGYWLITQNLEQEKTNDPCVVTSATNKPVALQYALHIQNDRLVLSSPELMPILLKRFSKKVRAGVSLSKWREFRKNKAVAGAIMSPKEARKGAVDLPSSLLLGALSKQPLKDIYAGAVVSVLPSPGFTLVIDAHATEAAWPQEVKTKYDAWISEAVRDLKEMPTLATLIQTLNVQAEGSILRISTTANKTTLDNLEKIPSEFLQMAFSGAFDIDKKTGSSDAEKIVKDSEVEKYARQFNFSTVQAFDDKNVFYKPDYVVGPFGVRVNKIGLLATDNSIVELNINVEGKGFENLSGELMHKSGESPTTSLSITSIEDKEGNNLLREELCGKKRNLIAEALSTTRDKQYVNNQWVSKSIKVFGDKSVRLKQKVRLSQIDKVKGTITVHAATRTKMQILNPPFSGQTIETSKVRMYLRKSNGGKLNYTLSGDISHILAVRAKNAKGQYLASSGSSSTGKETKMISKRFKGKVASLEIVVAEKVQSKEYPFEIDQIAPRYGKEDTGKAVEAKFTSKSRFLREYRKIKYNGACKDKQKVTLGPFLVCLTKFDDQWGKFGGEFEVFAPDEKALQNDISAGVLSIDSVLTESGEKIAFNKKSKIDFVYKFDTNYNKKKKEWLIHNRRLHAGYVKVLTDKEKFKDKKIKTIKGTLTIRIPKRPKNFDIVADKLGVISKRKNGLVVSVAGFEDWNTYFNLQGPINKVMRFMPIAKGGAILGTGNNRVNEKQYRTWGMSPDDKEKIKALPKTWQGMITVYGKPEVIRVFYADNFETIKKTFTFEIK